MKTEREIREEIRTLQQQSSKARRQYQIIYAETRIAALRWTLGEEND